MKITIYELLGMIKDKKELPKLIRYDNEEYKLTKILLEDNNYYFNYINEDIECIFPINTNHLNDEVEILAEPKGIPEKLDIGKILQTKKWKRDKKTWETINSIIDYLKNKGESNE